MEVADNFTKEAVIAAITEAAASSDYVPPVCLSRVL